MKMFEKYRCFSFFMLMFTTGLVVSSCGSDDGETDENQDEIDVYKCTGTVDGHEYVDLGLSVSWATKNIGANTITDSGNDYFWADPIGNITFTEAASRDVPNPPIKGTSLDIAAEKWGKNWALPSTLELEELSNKCSIVYCELNGKNGVKITGPNGNSIFLPEVTTRYTFDVKPPYKEKQSVDCHYMFSGEIFRDKNGKTEIECGYDIDNINGRGSLGITGGDGSWSTFAVRAVTHKGATGSLTGGGTTGGNTGGGTTGGSSTTYEKPEIGLENYTCYTTSIIVKYRIYNQDKAKVTSAKGYYGTSSASISTSASVAGSLIIIRITGLKKGTTYYVKCSATGKGGTTTSDATKLITDY